MSATDDKLLSVIRHEIEQAEEWSSEHLRDDQAKNLRYYLGMPMGNEVKGRSQVVSWDVFEAVESALPSFIEPFFSGDNIGSFAPRSAEDENYADQATDYVNVIIKDRNPGFNIFLTWIKDALLSKVGVVRAEWEKQEPVRQELRGLTDDQLSAIASDGTSKLLAHTAYDIPGMPQLNEAQVMQLGGSVPKLHDVILIKNRPGGCVKIGNVRPEVFVVTAGVPFERVRLIGEYVVYTRSELKELGFKQAAEIDNYDSGGMFSEENEIAINDDSASVELEEVRLFKGYVRFDRDNDGIAEWRRVLIGGGEDPILEDEEASDHNYAILTPIMIPHRIIGLGYADVARPIADIKTALSRQYLDSLYSANRPRTYVNVDSGVSLDDLLSDRIGGIIRGRGPAQNAVQPLITTAVSRDALEGLQLADGMRETRLGIPKYNPGLEADALHKTATGVRSINNLVDKRQKLTLRNFAETGVKRLFSLVLRLVTEYQDVPDIARLRGKFVPFDPRKWSPEMDVVIEVGVGTSDETETMALLQQFGQFMGWAQQVGAVQPNNVYEFGKALAKNARLKGAEQKFLTDPSTLPAPQPMQDPKMMLEQFKAQNDAQRFQAETVLRQQSEQMQAAMQMEQDRNRQEMEARQKTLESQQAAQLEAMRIASEERRDAEKLAFERWKVETEAANRAMIEQMKLSAQQVDLSPISEQIGQLTEYVLAVPKIIARDENGNASVVEKAGRRFAIQRENGRIVAPVPIQ